MSASSQSLQGLLTVSQTCVSQGHVAQRTSPTQHLSATSRTSPTSRGVNEPERFALATQLNFLFQRADQVKTLSQMSLFSRGVVADFLLEKDPLFAALTLSSDELTLYHKLYSYLQPQSPKPDLVIALQAPTDVLMQRVAHRGIRFEQQMHPSYLARLSDAYTRFFHNYDGAPVMFVNTEGLNFVDSASDVELLLARVAGMRGEREFFNVASVA